jgi:hypothetical protein
MRLADHIILNFNNNMSTAAVFLDIKKTFDMTWHSSLLYKLSEPEFLIGLIKLIEAMEAQRLQHFLDNWIKDGGEFVSHMHQLPFTARKIPGTHFC